MKGCRRGRCGRIRFVALLSSASVQRIWSLLSVCGLVLRCDAVFNNNVKFSGKSCVNLSNGISECGRVNAEDKKSGEV